MRPLNLLQDSPGTIALNVLHEAILTRNASGAGIALERLLNLDPASPSSKINLSNLA